MNKQLIQQSRNKILNSIRSGSREDWAERIDKILLEDFFTSSPTEKPVTWNEINADGGLGDMGYKSPTEILSDEEIREQAKDIFEPHTHAPEYNYSAGTEIYVEGAQWARDKILKAPTEIQEVETEKQMKLPFKYMPPTVDEMLHLTDIANLGIYQDKDGQIKVNCFSVSNIIHEFFSMRSTPLPDALQEVRAMYFTDKEKEAIISLWEDKRVEAVKRLGKIGEEKSYPYIPLQDRCELIKSWIKPAIPTIPNPPQVQEVREKEEFNDALAIEILARFSSLQGRNGSITKTRKEAFIDGALWAKQFTPASNPIKEEVECMGRAKRIQ
jgi:hypothetical protein